MLDQPRLKPATQPDGWRIAVGIDPGASGATVVTRQREHEQRGRTWVAVYRHQQHQSGELVVNMRDLALPYTMRPIVWACSIETVEGRPSDGATNAFRFGLSTGRSVGAMMATHATVQGGARCMEYGLVPDELTPTHPYGETPAYVGIRPRDWMRWLHRPEGLPKSATVAAVNQAVAETGLDVVWPNPISTTRTKRFTLADADAFCLWLVSLATIHPEAAAPIIAAVRGAWPAQ